MYFLRSNFDVSLRTCSAKNIPAFITLKESKRVLAVFLSIIFILDPDNLLETLRNSSSEPSFNPDLIVCVILN